MTWANSRPKEARRSNRSSRRLWLTILVHIDGLRAAPASYLRAVFWRVRGLKLRSRNALGSLIARSRHAYPLWILKRELLPERGSALTSGAQSCSLNILPIIENLGSVADLQATLESLTANRFEGTVLILQIDGDLPPQLQGDNTKLTLRLCRSSQELHHVITQLSPGWLLPMLSGDSLAPAALSIYEEAIMDTRADVAYADDDALDAANMRGAPHFKPDWNAELFQYQDYIAFACVIRGETASTDITWSSMSWARTMIAAALARQSSSPVHIPHILHHRRNRDRAMAIPHPPAPNCRLPHPSVTIIIPTRNQLELLATCLEGLNRTDYSNFNCLIMDNDSDDYATIQYLSSIQNNKYQCIKFPGDFNYSKINNFAVEHARGDILCFLNNDIEIIDSRWLDALVAQVVRPGVGAVGAKLLYPDGTIQHAGIILGIGGAAGHAHRFCKNTEAAFFDRPHLPQYTSAVTGACLVVQKKHFQIVGGFDEIDFPVAFNDVDLCLKLADAGRLNVYEPRATLIHHESRSRGSDLLKHNRARFSAELASLKRKWHTDVIKDPWHNPNLSQLSEQFVIDLL